MGLVNLRLMNYEVAKDYFIQEIKNIERLTFPGKRYNQFDLVLKNRILGIVNTALQNHLFAKEHYQQAAHCAFQEAIINYSSPIQKQNNEDWRFLFATLLSDISSSLLELFCYEESIEYALEALNIIRDGYRKPNQLYFKCSLNLVQAYNILGVYDKARQLIEELNNSFKEEATNQGFIKSHTYIILKQIYADLLDEVGEYNKAIECLKDIQESIKNHNGVFSHEYATYLNNAAVIYRKCDLLKEALSHQQNAVNIIENILGRRSELYALYIINLGEIYLKLGKKDLAKKYYTEAHIILEAHVKIRKEASVILKEDIEVESWTHSYCYISLGNYFYEQGQYDLAYNYYIIALSLVEGQFGDKHTKYADLLYCIAKSLNGLLRCDEALIKLNQALIIYSEKHEIEHPSIADVYDCMGTSYRYKNEYINAIEYHKRGLSIYEIVYGEKNITCGISHFNIGNSYKAIKEYDLAIKEYNEAIEIFRANRDEEHPYYKEASEQLFNTKLIRTCRLGEECFKTGNFNEAVKNFLQCVKLIRFGGQHYIEVCIFLFTASIEAINKGNTLIINDILEFLNDFIYSINKCNDQYGYWSAVSQYISYLAVCISQKGYIDEAINCLESSLKTSSSSSIKHNLAALYNTKVYNCTLNIKAQYMQLACKMYQKATKFMLSDPSYKATCAEYGMFLINNPLVYGYNQYDHLKKVLQIAITIEDYALELEYGQLEIITTVEPLQLLFKKLGIERLTVKVYALSHYLLIKAYCINDNIAEAKCIIRQFKDIVTRPNNIEDSTTKCINLFLLSNAFKEIGWEASAQHYMRCAEKEFSKDKNFHKDL
jgi:tetratricopeptide (TPR) repeat protein